MPPAPMEETGSTDGGIPRRRRIFVFLVLSAAATLIVGLIPAYRELLRFHVWIDFALGGYVAYLIRLKSAYEDEGAEDLEEEQAYEAEVLYADGADQEEALEDREIEEETEDAADLGNQPRPEPRPEPVYEPAFAQSVVAPVVESEQRRRYAPRHSVSASHQERPKARRILLADEQEEEQPPVHGEGYPRAKEA